MAYISLFRKYRSEDFSDLVGQEHIVKTISNSIKTGKIGQGYLFCGTRGTGKTTVARIIAKALNCQNGPTDHPCGTCSICQSIKDGSCLDVVEMDAASNRSVEDVEKIVESVKYRPVECRYKVYIIDEAHQLSNQAKDAFLKTLEEPPEYVVFILATTEAHKIPVTIRSRCQQFDFKRGSIEDISGRIKYVAEKEGVSITDEAVALVARNANGSYRDSLSILEQIISFSGNNITPTEVYNVLGLVEEDVLFKISEAILTGDIKQAFYFGANLIDRGKDIKEVLNNLASFFRDLLSVKINAQDLGPHYKSEAGNYTEKQLMDIISAFVNGGKDLRLSDQQRLTFELAFMQAIKLLQNVEETKVVEKVIERVVEKPISVPVSQVAKPAPLRVIQDNVPAQPKVAPSQTPKPQEAPKRQIDFDKHIRGFWQKFLEYIRRGQRDPQLATCLQAGVPTAYDDGVLTITFKHGMEYQLEACKAHITNLETFLFECYKTPIKVDFQLFKAPEIIKVQEEEEVKVVPPDFSEDAPVIEENLPQETVPKENWNNINNATLENTAFKNTEKQENDLLETPEAPKEEPQVDTKVDVLMDSPLNDKKFEEHPKFEELKSLFPDAEIETIENN